MSSYGLILSCCCVLLWVDTEWTERGGWRWSEWQRKPLIVIYGLLSATTTLALQVQGQSVKIRHYTPVSESSFEIQTLKRKMVEIFLAVLDVLFSKLT